MSDNDRSLRRSPAVKRVLPARAELLSNVSTASWSMRFSLRQMTSGAPMLISFLRRLLRLMTRRYRSFKSDAAKRPPSSCTIGRRSGGITARRVRIVHSALMPAFLSELTSLMRFMIFLSFCPLLFSRSFSSSPTSVSRLIFMTISRSDSAPVPARKTCPNFMFISRNLSSESTVPTARFLRSSPASRWLFFRGIEFIGRLFIESVDLGARGTALLQSFLGLLILTLHLVFALVIAFVELALRRSLRILLHCNHDVRGEVDDLLERLDRKIEKETEAGGELLRNQIWVTGTARLMWPMRSRRTMLRVTSTPHFSQTTPA